MNDSKANELSSKKIYEEQNITRVRDSFRGVRKILFHEEHDGAEVYIYMKDDMVHSEIYLRDLPVEFNRNSIKSLQFNGNNRLIKNDLYHWESEDKESVHFNLFYPYGFPILSKEFHFKRSIRDILWHMNVYEFLNTPAEENFNDNVNSEYTICQDSYTRKDLLTEKFYKEDPRLKVQVIQSVEIITYSFKPFEILLKRKQEVRKEE